MADTALIQLAGSDRNPIQEQEYQNLLKSSNIPFELRGGKAFVEGFGSGGNDFGSQARAFFGQGGQAFAPSAIDQAKKLRDFTIQSNQPLISSLQAQIPETEQKFTTEQTRLAGEKQPLTQRYQGIIDELTRREGLDISAAGTRTSREFGARGIPASSTLYADEINKATGGIRQAYGGQIKDVGFEREEGLRGIDQLISTLAGQSTEAKRSILNAIGQLQSGSPADAIQGALSLLGLHQQQAQNQSQNELSQRGLDLRQRELDLSQNQTPNPYVTLGEGQTLFNLLTGSPMYTNPKTYKPSDTFGDDWE